jgi:hypothetical protein
VNFGEEGKGKERERRRIVGIRKGKDGHVPAKQFYYMGA